MLAISLLLPATMKLNSGSSGNPEIVSPQVPASAYFADSIPFSATVSDTKVPLSTLKAQLYYGEDKVSETTIRTKTDGHLSRQNFMRHF